MICCLPPLDIIKKGGGGLHVRRKLFCIVQKFCPMLPIFCKPNSFIVAIMLLLITANFERLLLMSCIQGGNNFAPLSALQSLALPISEMTGPNAKAQARKLCSTWRQNLSPLDYDSEREVAGGVASGELRRETPQILTLQ